MDQECNYVTTGSLISQYASTQKEGGTLGGLGSAARARRPLSRRPPHPGAFDALRPRSRPLGT